MSRRVTVVGIGIVGFTLALTEAVHGNGHEFFAPAQGKSVDLVYFGRIKDKSTGRLIREQAFFTIFDNATGMSFPFTSDGPAHYRSPDVGAAIKELGGIEADPKQLDIQLMVAGYRDAKVSALPRATKGAVELNFLMEPASLGDASSTHGATPPDFSSSHWNWSLAIGAVVLAIAGMMARTLARR
jgi:hypothetical protein